MEDENAYFSPQRVGLYSYLHKIFKKAKNIRLGNSKDVSIYYRIGEECFHFYLIHPKQGRKLEKGEHTKLLVDAGPLQWF